MLRPVWNVKLDVAPLRLITLVLTHAMNSTIWREYRNEGVMMTHFLRTRWRPDWSEAAPLLLGMRGGPKERTNSLATLNRRTEHLYYFAGGPSTKSCDRRTLYIYHHPALTRSSLNSTISMHNLSQVSWYQTQAHLLTGPVVQRYCVSMSHRRFGSKKLLNTINIWPNYTFITFTACWIAAYKHTEPARMP